MERAATPIAAIAVTATSTRKATYTPLLLFKPKAILPYDCWSLI